jgi:LysM repeat protein
MGENYPMKTTQQLGFALAAALLGAVMLFGVAAAQSGNLLTNGGFEGGFTQVTDGVRVPNGWTRWAQTSGGDEPCRNIAPNYNENTQAARVYQGGAAASYWGTNLGYTAGLYQQVSATTGTTYQLTAWGYSWSAGTLEATTSDDFTQMRIGIDPNGGTNPFSGDIVWSADQFPMDQYAQFSVEAEANADEITVFLWARPNWCNPRNDTYWDSVSLTSVGTTDNTNDDDATAQPTAQPTQGGGSVAAGTIPVATPDGSGTVTHVVNPGETLLGIVNSYSAQYEGVTEQSVRDLNTITGDIIQVGQQLTIVEGATSGNTPAPTPDEAEPTLEESESTPVAEATAAPVEGEGEAAGTATICVLLYSDQAGDGFRDPANDTLLPDATFAVSNGTENVATYTTDGTSEPHCFTGLSPGSYTITWTNPDYAATTEKTQLVNVQAGDTIQQEFGARNLGEPVSAQTEEGSEALSGVPPTVIALIAAAGVIFMLGGAGVAGWYFLMRGNQTVTTSE